MKFKQLLKDVDNYYTDKINTYGSTPMGVDWNSLESQHLRFDQLLKGYDKENFSIIDYGCGYGALFDYLEKKTSKFYYYGYDISDKMISKAVHLHQNHDNCRFTAKEKELKTADYAVASGIFNVKLDYREDDWHTYIIETLQRLNDLSQNGFSFNMLTKYSDKDKMRPDLYYGDPLLYFDYCKSRFSKYVSLIHDYPLYEFTILVKKEQGL